MGLDTTPGQSPALSYNTASRNMSAAPTTRQHEITASVIVAALREPRDHASVDATAHVLTTGAARGRTVVTIRIRSRLVDAIYKILIEQLEAGASAGRALIERETWKGISTSWPPIAMRLMRSRVCVRSLPTARPRPSRYRPSVSTGW